MNTASAIQGCTSCVIHTSPSLSRTMFPAHISTPVHHRTHWIAVLSSLLVMSLCITISHYIINVHYITTCTCTVHTILQLTPLPSCVSKHYIVSTTLSVWFIHIVIWHQYIHVWHVQESLLYMYTARGNQCVVIHQLRLIFACIYTCSYAWTLDMCTCMYTAMCAHLQLSRCGGLIYAITPPVVHWSSRNLIWSSLSDWREGRERES